jgi:hypothetical protein
MTNIDASNEFVPAIAADEDDIAIELTEELPSETTAPAPVFIVCSPRPRVGKTLVARLVLDFHLYTGRPVLPFDANPNDPVLSDFFESESVSVADTQGQMELFDQLIVADGVAKVVDVASDQFDTFFDVMHKIGFAGEAERAGIPVVILYVVEDHVRSADAYRRLVDRFPDVTLVPVHNELTESYNDPMAPHPPVSAPAIHIPPLPPYLDGVIRRRGFSFAHHLQRGIDQPTQLDRWAARPFVALHELQMRLALNGLAPLLNHAA